MRTWIALSLWRGMTYLRLKKMLQVCKHEEQLFLLSENEWRKLGLFPELFNSRVSLKDVRVSAAMGWLEEPGNWLLPITSEHYPSLLREISSAPLILYGCGQVDLLTKRQLAIVGSRRATPRAFELAHELAYELASAGVVVTSGLALGIDTAAHRGILEGGGKTIAVMANGLGSVYPFSNADLAQAIKVKGVLLSEQAPWVGPSAKLFPRRNRIVSGLSQGVLVVQAGKKSGSLITARLALEQNREVMAVPGDVGCAQAGGCHWLLKQGAALVETVEDVYQCMGWEEKVVSDGKTPKKQVLTLNEGERALLNCIDSSGTTLEKIVERYSGKDEDVLPGLSSLELAGVIHRLVQGYCLC